VAEKLRVNPGSVFAMVSLIRNKNITTNKTETTVSEYTSTVKEIVDLGDDWGTGEAEADVEGVSAKRGPKRRTIRVMYIAEGSVQSGGREAGVGAEGERGNVEESGLEDVGGCEGSGVVGVGLEWENGRESGGCCEEISVGRVLD